MKARIRTNITRQDIVRFFTNSTSPAALLAVWQDPSPPARHVSTKGESAAMYRNLLNIRMHRVPGQCCFPCGFTERGVNHREATMADWRHALIHDPAFRSSKVPCVSDPDTGFHGPVLCLGSDDHILIKELTEGRDVLNHCGWYCDAEDQRSDDTIEAVAVELEDFPGIIFEAARDNGGGSVAVYLAEFRVIGYSECKDDWDTDNVKTEVIREVIRSADSTAQALAEDEQEYRLKDREEQEA